MTQRLILVPVLLFLGLTPALADPASYIGLGDIYAHAGDAEFARNSYEKALDIDPQQPVALKAIAALGKSEKPDTASAAP